MRATSICVLVCLVVTGCGGDETASPSGDAAVDATPIDASLAVVCSATLIAPCDTTTLTSSTSCLAMEPVAGTDCAPTPQQDCYYWSTRAAS